MCYPSDLTCPMLQWTFQVLKPPRMAGLAVRFAWLLARGSQALDGQGVVAISAIGSGKTELWVRSKRFRFEPRFRTELWHHYTVVYIVYLIFIPFSHLFNTFFLRVASYNETSENLFRSEIAYLQIGCASCFWYPISFRRHIYQDNHGG